jgi:hypothetical protein
MTIFRRFASIAAAPLIVAGVVQAQDAPGDSARLAALDQAIEDAITRQQVAFLDSTLVPTFRWTHAGGPNPVESRERFLANVGRPVASETAMRTVSRTADSIVVEVHGDQALTTGRIHVVRTGGNNPLLRDFTLRYLRMYRRDAASGRWMLVMHRAIALTAGPPGTSPAGMGRSDETALAPSRPWAGAVEAANAISRETGAPGVPPLAPASGRWPYLVSGPRPRRSSCSACRPTFRPSSRPASESNR